MGNGTPASAYVLHNQPGQVNVQDPNAYNPTMAAHEATHGYQYTRNDQFQDNLNAKLPNGTMNAGNYNYGDLRGHHDIGNYNAEQQATMVGDLTNNNMSAPHTKAELQKFDDTKNALEPMVRQLQRIPAQDTSVAGRIDHAFHTHGFGDPIAYAKGMMGLTPPPKMAVANPTPQAPSAVLGYANPSKLVR
jgi:hypothetical protein